jgi:hypothetical protein
LCITANSGGNVRFGSKADIAALPINVRFTPKSGHHTGCAADITSALLMPRYQTKVASDFQIYARCWTNGSRLFIKRGVITHALAAFE